MSGYKSRSGTYKTIDYDKEFFPTPHALCLSALNLIPGIGNTMNVLDPGAGTGAWGKAFKEIRNKYSMLTGVEKEVVKWTDDYDFWIVGDYLTIPDNFKKYEVIFGNPPFSLAEDFIRKSMNLLEQKGYLLFLLRLSFLEGRNRQLGLYTKFPPKEVHVLTRRPSFSKDNKTGMVAYAIYIWQEGYKGDTKLKWLYWNDKN